MRITVLIIGSAIITYLSRLAAVALLPAPRGGPAAMVKRLPAPLFAALAAVTLISGEASLPEPPVFAAVAGALLASRTRSLLTVLLAGLAAFGVASILI